MSSLLTEENFSFAVSVLLPGFIILATFMMAFRTRLPATFFVVVLSVVLSFFYANVLSSTQAAIPILARTAPKPIAELVNFVAVPSIIGFLGGTLWERLAPLLRKAGIPIRSPIPTAWDYAFAKRSGCWLLIRFKDVERSPVRAFYNRHGFAGTDLDHIDLYVTEVHEKREWIIFDGTKNWEWEEVVPPLAMWIAGSEIHSIEFMEDLPAENDDARQAKTLKGRLSRLFATWPRKSGSPGQRQGQAGRSSSQA